MPVADAAGMLVDRFGCSLRQARRYVDRAVAGGRMPVAEPAVVFTVKLPAALAIRVREHARESGEACRPWWRRRWPITWPGAVCGPGPGEQAAGRDAVRV